MLDWHEFDEHFSDEAATFDEFLPGLLERTKNEHKAEEAKAKADEAAINKRAEQEKSSGALVYRVCKD